MSIPLWRFRLAAVWVLLAVVPAWGAADEAPYSVRAYIQPEQGASAGQPIQLVVLVEGLTTPRIMPPQIVGLKNLRVVGGPNTRLNSVWRNGRTSVTYQLVYSLLPESEGRAEIPALSLQLDSRIYQTEPIRLEVGKAAPGMARPPGPAATPREAEPGERGDIILEADLGASEVWVGQPVLLSVTLYTAERLSNASFTQQPALDNFWVEELEVEPDAESHWSTRGGRRYLAYPALRKLLVPQTSGEFEIGPFEMQMQARLSGGGDIFDFFSLGRGRTIARRSQPLKLRVKPLPAQGRPQDFSGAVGSYSLRVALDRQESEVNDAVALKATVEGEGFLKLAQAPHLEAPPEIKVLDPKVSESFRTTGGRMVSRKAWEWVIVPLEQGELRLPELRFDYFDPREGRYETARAEAPLLLVKRGEKSPDSALARGEIQMQRRDILFIKPLHGSLAAESPRAHQRPAYVLLLLLPLLWTPMLILLGRRHARLRQDQGLARGSRARRRARARLQAAASHLEEADATSFHQQLAGALVDYVADRFNRSSAGLTYDLAEELLATQGLDATLRRRFRSCLEACDFARFVPASGKVERRAELLAEAKALIHELDRAW